MSGQVDMCDLGWHWCRDEGHGGDVIQVERRRQRETYGLHHMKHPLQKGGGGERHTERERSLM